jgi:hypothetical protein
VQALVTGPGGLSKCPRRQSPLVTPRTSNGRRFAPGTYTVDTGTRRRRETPMDAGGSATRPLRVRSVRLALAHATDKKDYRCRPARPNTPGLTLIPMAWGRGTQQLKDYAFVQGQSILDEAYYRYRWRRRPPTADSSIQFPPWPSDNQAYRASPNCWPRVGNRSASSLTASPDPDA